LDQFGLLCNGDEYPGSAVAALRAYCRLWTKIKAAEQLCVAPPIADVWKCYTYDHRTFESYLWDSNAFVKSHPVKISVLFLWFMDSTQCFELAKNSRSINL